MSKELYAQRAELVKQQRALVDAAEAENREMTPEEEQTWDQMDADFTKVNDQIEKLEATQRRREEMAKRQALVETGTPPQKPQIDKGGMPAHQSLMEVYNAARQDGLDRRDAFKEAIKAQNQEMLRAEAKAFNDYLKYPGMVDHAALQVDDQGQGGSMVIPQAYQGLQDPDPQVGNSG